MCSFMQCSDPGFFFPNPDRQKIRIRSGSMKKHPKTVSKRKTHFCISYFALSKLSFWVKFLQNLSKEIEKHHLDPITLLNNLIYLKY